MKKKILAFSLLAQFFITSTAFSNNVRIEKSDSVFQATEHQAIAGANIVKASGYRCDSISKFKPLILSSGFHLICNNWQYEYELKDVGGNIRVIAK